MVPHGILEPRKGTVVKERRLERRISDGRCPKFISVTRIAGNLLQIKILVLCRSIECDVAHNGSNLRYPNDVWRKITEHLVGCTGDCVTLNTSAGSKEQQGAFLLLVGQSVLLASSTAMSASQAGRRGFDPRLLLLEISSNRGRRVELSR